MAEQLGFYIDTDRCLQCHACELACTSWNGLEAGIRWRKVIDLWSGRFPKVRNLTVSLSCLHCENPSCVPACPEKAIFKRVSDGIVLVEDRKCVGCRTCEGACPFGIPQYGKNGTMQKCHMCRDRLAAGKEPSCVATCPSEALRFGAIRHLVQTAALKSGRRMSASTLPCLVVSGRFEGSIILKMLDRDSSVGLGAK